MPLLMVIATAAITGATTATVGGSFMAEGITITVTGDEGTGMVADMVTDAIEIMKAPVNFEFLCRFRADKVPRCA